MWSAAHHIYGRLLRSPLRPVLEMAPARAIRDRLTPFDVLPDGSVELRAQGFLLRLPRPFAWRYARGFEPLSMSWLTEKIMPGTTVADVGAHVGFVALVMSRQVGPTGIVHCFEPVAGNVHYLRHNVAANRALNVKIHPVAAGREDGIRRFYLTDTSDSQGFYPHPLARSSEETEVRQIRLDDVIDRVDMALIDVEGAELDVISGMTRLLEERPSMLVEWAPACQRAAGRRPDEIVETLRTFGYAVHVLDDFFGRVCSPEDVMALLRQGDLPQRWYANLACEPK